MRRAVSFQLATAQRLPGHLRAGGMRLLVACLAIWGLGMFSPSIDRGAADVVRMVGWGVILAGLLMLGLGTQRVLARLDFPLLGAGVARAAALLLALRRIGLVLLARPPDADVRRLLLLLRRLDGVHQLAGRHHRRQQGRAYGNDDRAPDRHCGARGLPRLVPRLRRGRGGGCDREQGG